MQKGIAITVLVSVFMLLPGSTGRSKAANSALVPFNLVPESDITVMNGEAVPWKLLWNEARKLARTGDYSGAIGKYESLLEQKANLQEARWELARLHMHLEHWDKAATILELLIESDPSRGAYLDGLGRVMWEKGLYDRAVDLFKRAYEQDQTDQTALAGMVEGMLKLDKKKESLPYLEQLHRLQPDNLGIHRYLAMITYDLGYYEKARPLLAELAEMKDVDQEVLERAARVHDALGLAKIAARYWQRIVDREPENSMAHSRLADIFENGGQPREALPHLLFLVKQDPAQARLLARIGRAYERIGQPGKALTFYRRYLGLQPEDPVILRAVVKIEAALGKKDETLTALEDYFQVEPESGPADLKLAARLYDGAGRFHKAIPLYRKLLELSPNDPDLLAALANDLLAIGENEGALSMWKHLAGIVDDPLTVYRPMADLLFRLGRNRELSEILEKIQELDEHDLQTTMNLANLYLDQGRLELAAGLFSRLAEAGHQGTDFLLGRGRLYDLTDKPEHALHDYEAYLAQRPDRQDILLRAARLAGELGLYTKAIRQLDAIRGKATGNNTDTGLPELEFTRAQALVSGGFYQEAVEIYRALVSSDSGTGSDVRALKMRAWLALAGIYRSADLPFEEEQVLREALNTGYGRTPLVTALFEAALRNNRLDDAEVWLADLRKQQTGRTGPDVGRIPDWQLRLFAARLLAGRGAFRAAIKKGRLLFAEFSAVHRSGDPREDEQHPRLRTGLALGRFLLASGKLNQAASVGTTLLAEGWRDFEIFVLLQQIYMQSTDQVAAQEITGQMIKNFWNGAEQDADLGELFRLILLYNQYGNAGMKMHFARIAVQKAPESLKAQILLAETEMEQNCSEEAHALLAGMNKKYPGNTRVLSDLTKTMFKNGSLVEALAYCDTILARQPQRADILLLKARMTWARHKWNEAIAIYKSYLQPSANVVLADRLAVKGIVLDLAPKVTFWNKITFSEGEPPELAAVVMSAPFVLTESEENETVNNLAAPLYARYRWQRLFAAELAARRSIQRRQYNQAANQFESLVRDLDPSDSLLFDLAGIYSQLERLEEEAVVYERLQIVNPDLPGLKAAIERNRLERRPQIAMGYGFDEQEGWDFYKAVTKKWGETTAKFSPKTKHEIGLSISRINYQATNNEGNLWANRTVFSYRATLSHALSAALDFGLENPAGDYANTEIIALRLEGRVGDTLKGHCSFSRDVTPDTIASLKRNITNDLYSAGFSADFFPRLTLGADYGQKKFNDHNQTDRYSLWSSYIFFFDPTYLRFKFNYDFADSHYGPNPGPALPDGFASDDHPYYTPQNYWLSEFSLYFRHQLASDTLGRGVPRYYTVECGWGYDSHDDKLQTLAASLFLELTRNVILKGSASIGNLGTYKTKKLLFSAAYRW